MERVRSPERSGSGVDFSIEPRKNAVFPRVPLMPKTLNHDVGQPTFAAIGRVASAWSQFEYLLDASIWNLAKVDANAGACITSQLFGPARRLDAIVALAALNKTDDSTISKLNKLAKRALDLADKRNRAVHDTWAIVDGDLARLHVSARRRLKHHRIPETRKALITLHNQIVELTNDYFQLMLDPARIRENKI